MKIPMVWGLCAAMMLSACSSARPVLYENDRLKTVGKEAAEQDIESCKEAAESAGAEAGSQEALAQFDGTVLRSLEETETALSIYANALRRREALQAARNEAEVAAKIVRAQQREGQVHSLALLDAERTFAESEAKLADINGQVASAQINLFRALGGGWSA